MILHLRPWLYKPRWQRIFYPLSHIGKLALTSYLMQTVAGLLLFYHFGFKLFMKTSPAINYLLALAFFAYRCMLPNGGFVIFITARLNGCGAAPLLESSSPFCGKILR